MQERDIFIKAIQQDDPRERTALLDEACRGNASLRQRVEQLLAEHLREESFILDAPPVAPIATDMVESSVEQPGTVIGRYQLAEPIGEGGFGVVYLAQQTEPVRRQVALKIVKPGMDSKQVLARFRAERQALAQLDHRNIAKVLDGGTTDLGRPYFVMELVKGVPITDYCDRCQLDTSERLDLFVAVCRAVEHAHQNGIIHRDLKPSNVLVEMQDGQPAPKIIDFGVAKAIGQKLTEQTLRTQFTQMIGTPMYMSPEQAELSPTDVDTRSDVYSLGVLLYELLTGQTPYVSQRLSVASFDELRHIIREEEPPRPSARVSTLAADVGETISQTHRLDSRLLAKHLRGELDWIVMKAVAKDRTRRYRSANDLAADIERFVRHEPVMARPASTLYRVGKFTRRNRALVASLATVFVALSAGLALATVGFVTAQQRLAEVTNEQRDNQVLIEILGDIYHIPWGMELQGQQSTVRDSFERLTVGLEDRLRDHPKVEIKVRKIFAGMLRRSGEHVKAREHLQRVLDLAQHEYGPNHELIAETFVALADEIQWENRGEPIDPRITRDYALKALEIYNRRKIEDSSTSHANFCLALSFTQDPHRFHEAEHYFRTALRIAKELANGKDSNLQVFALSDLASHLSAKDEHGEALQLIQKSVEMSQRLMGDQDMLTASVISAQGEILRNKGDADGALACWQQAWGIYEKNDSVQEPRGLRILLQTAETYHVTHQHHKANQTLDRMEDICRRHEDWPWLVECLFQRGWGYQLQEDHVAAKAVLQEALNIARENPSDQGDMFAFVFCYLTSSLESLGEVTEAQHHCETVLPLIEQHSSRPVATELSRYAYAWNVLHSGTTDQGKLHKALHSAQQGLEQVRLRPDNGREPHFLLMIAMAQYKLAKPQQAVESLRMGLSKIYESPYPSLDTHCKGIPKSWRELEATQARYLVELNRFSEAENVFRVGIQRRIDLLGPKHLQVALAEMRFGEFLLENDHFEDAEEQFRRAADNLQFNPELQFNREAAHANRERVMAQRVKLYSAWGKTKEAAKWQAEFDALYLKESDGTTSKNVDLKNAESQ